MSVKVLVFAEDYDITEGKGVVMPYSAIADIKALGFRVVKFPNSVSN